MNLGRTLQLISVELGGVGGKQKEPSMEVKVAHQHGQPPSAAVSLLFSILWGMLDVVEDICVSDARRMCRICQTSCTPRSNALGDL